MPGEWRQFSLSELADLSGGFAFKSEDYTPVGRFVLRTLNIRDDGSISRDDAVYIPEHLCPQYSRFELRPHDTLFVMVGATLGKVGYVRETDLPALLNQNMWLIRAKPGFGDPCFVQYAFRHAVRASLNWASGSARDFLRRDDCRNLHIPAPPLSEQQVIASVLRSLDDKIELNRRMNQTLEAMAQALFKSWFVDFDPVRTKAAGKKPSSLNSATAALFPASFQDSPLGPVPRGWRIVTVTETCESIFSGGTPSTQIPDYWGGGIPWLSSGETRNSFIIGTEKTITEAGVSNSSTRLARPGSTVIAGAGQGHTRGQTSLLTFESYINQSVVALAANPLISSDLFLFFDLARRYEQFRQLSDSHSSRGSLTTKLLAGVKRVLPPRELVSRFDETAGPAVAHVTANLHQSHTLAQLRDTLLPKLLSGELRVPAAEKLLERTT